MSNNLVNQSTKAISTDELRWIGPVLAVVSSGPMDLFFQTKIDNIIEKLWEKATDLDNKYIETNFQTNCRLNKFTQFFKVMLKK